MPPKLWIPGSVGRTPLKHWTDQTRRAEALSLYREILRAAKHFHWADENSGQPWNKLLKDQARKEFEESRRETDPLITARMLVTGRDCLQQVQNKFNAATAAAWKRIEQDRSHEPHPAAHGKSGSPPPPDDAKK
jgi:hypothetical protein